MMWTNGSLLDQNTLINKWLKVNPEWQGETSSEGQHYLRMTKQARYAFLGWVLAENGGLSNLGIERERLALYRQIKEEGGRFDPRANVDPDSAFGKLYDYLLERDVACPFEVFPSGEWCMWVPLAKTLQVFVYVPGHSGNWSGFDKPGDPLVGIARRKWKIRGKQTTVVGIRDLLLAIGNQCKCSLVRPAAEEIRKGLCQR